MKETVTMKQPGGTYRSFDLTDEKITAVYRGTEVYFMTLGDLDALRAGRNSEQPEETNYDATATD